MEIICFVTLAASVLSNWNFVEMLELENVPASIQTDLIW